MTAIHVAPHFLLAPDHWLVIFSPQAATTFTNLIALGHWKHVCAIGHVPAMRTWVLYDPQIDQSRIALAPGSDGLTAMLNYVAPAERHVSIIRIAPRAPRRLFPPAFFCTTAIAHLLGLPTVWRPDALWRQCIRHGGEVVRCEHPALGDTRIYEQAAETGSASR